MNIMESFTELCFHLLHVPTDYKRSVFAWVLWSLWKKRNTKLLEGKDENIHQVMFRAMHARDDWNREVILGNPVNMVNQQRHHIV